MCDTAQGVDTADLRMAWPLCPFLFRWIFGSSASAPCPTCPLYVVAKTLVKHRSHHHSLRTDFLKQTAGTDHLLHLAENLQVRAGCGRKRFAADLVVAFLAAPMASALHHWASSPSLSYLSGYASCQSRSCRSGFARHRVLLRTERDGLCLRDQHRRWIRTSPNPNPPLGPLRLLWTMLLPQR